MNQKTIEQVAERMGLSEAACINMLGAGYVYVEEFGRIPRWEKPTHVS